MITLLGSFLGLFGSFIPELLKHLRDISDKRHELQILDRQISLMQLNQKHRLEELEIIGTLKESEALYHHARPTRITWVDALSGSVRPILTYVFFLLYAIMKISQILILLPSIPLPDSILNIWQGEDQALFAAVMSFWFGQRSLSKLRKSR